jgi:hypothetical protein
VSSGNAEKDTSAKVLKGFSIEGVQGKCNLCGLGFAAIIARLSSLIFRRSDIDPEHINWDLNCTLEVRQIALHFFEGQ